MEHTFYCQYNFFTELIENLKKEEDPFDLSYSHVNTSKIFNHLNSGNVFFDLSRAEILTKLEENPYLKKLVKSYNGIRPLLLNFEGEEVLKLPQNTVFLMSENRGIIEKLGEKFGLWFLNNSDLKNKVFSKPNSFYFNLSNKNWGNLRKNKHKCNALILTDPFLFSDSYQLHNALFPLLKCILPKKLTHQDLEFQITFVFDHKYPIDYKIEYENLKDNLNALYNYKIKINSINFGFHDRNIFTNYYKITAGTGFVLKNDENILRFENLLYYEDLDEEYIIKLNLIKEKNESNQKHGDNFDNRLFSIV